MEIEKLIRIIAIFIAILTIGLIIANRIMFHETTNNIHYLVIILVIIGLIQSRKRQKLNK